MRSLALAALVLTLSPPAVADANALCRWTGFCIYLSPGFTLTVVDAETGRPLPDVYAWATWVEYAAHGLGGPLMVQDARSDAEGHVTFPSWGPRLGSRAGLVRGMDPAVIFFKPGRATLVVQNDVPLGASEHAAIRGMSGTAKTVPLEPFRGTAADWVSHLRKLVYPGLTSGISDKQRDEFGALYLRRIEIVARELSKLPADLPEVSSLRGSLQQSERLFRGGRR
jgi:hypothetical protein